MEIYKFRCGFCRIGERIVMTRKELRKHLREHIRNNLFNEMSKRNEKKVKQNWVIKEEFK